MQLTTTGAIKIDGHLARFTTDAKWAVSRLDTVIGYVDSLAEAESLIERHRERVRARLALVQRKAEERRAEAADILGQIEQDNDDQEWDERVSELDYSQGDEF